MDSTPQETSPPNNKPNPLSRRRLPQVGASTLGLLATSGITQASLCPATSTPRQICGFFFPDADVVSFPIHEGEDSSLPLILSNDNDLTFVKGKSGTAQGQIIYFRVQILGRTSVDSKVCQPIAG